MFVCYFVVVFDVCFLSKKKGKDQKPMQSSTTPDQDTNGKVTLSQLDITNESQEVRPLPAGDHKASINRYTRKYSKNKTEITYIIHKRSTALERLVKYVT